MKSLQLLIYTPEGKEFDDEVDFVQVHTSDSYLGILPEHAPLISDVIISKQKIKKNGVDEAFAVGEGVLNVKHNEVKLIVSSLERASEIDVDRALAAKQRAEERLSRVDSKDVDIARAKAALARALNRIAVSGK